MTTKITYQIIFAGNTGSRAVDAIASSCGGSWRNAVTRYDGEHDLAFIDVNTDNCEALESMLDDDSNVISYGQR